VGLFHWYNSNNNNNNNNNNNTRNAECICKACFPTVWISLLCEELIIRATHFYRMVSGYHNNNKKEKKGSYEFVTWGHSLQSYSH
jgi:hypothetical protein